MGHGQKGAIFHGMVVFVVSVDTGKVLDDNGKCIMKQSAQLTFQTHQRLWKLQVQSSCGSDLSKRMVCNIHHLLETETVHHTNL